MPPKADKLQQIIETVKTLCNRQLAEYPELGGILVQINKIEASLQSKKLTLQIVAEEEKLGQAGFDLLTQIPDSQQAYDIKYDLLPEFPVANGNQNQSVTRLKLVRFLQDNIVVDQEYLLQEDNEYVMGRNPQLNLFLDGSVYRGVSWQHAAIKTTVSGGEKKWVVEDLNSRNGVFVNGERINGSVILQDRDIITLAYPSYKEGIACWYFQQEAVTPTIDENHPYYDVIDCDVLLLVADYKGYQWEKLTSFLKTLNGEKISKYFLLLDLPVTEEEKSLEATISQWEAWLESLSLPYKVEFYPLTLTPYYQEDFPLDFLSKSMQKRYDKFVKAFGNITKRQPENLLAKRLSVKLASLILPLEKILQEEYDELRQKITNLQNEKQSLVGKNWKELIKNALAQVKEDKEKFFKQVRWDLNQAKAALLDNFSRKSIVGQVQNFVDNLKPVVFKKEGQPHVKLAIDSHDTGDVNEILINFIVENLETWANKEWEKVLHLYGNGGLIGLLNRCYDYINFLPDLFPHSPFNPPADLDIRGNFLVSFMTIESEVRHKQDSLPAFVMKSIRSNLMQIMMMATLLFALLGLKVGKNEMFAQVSLVFKRFPFLLGLAVFALIFFLITSYNQDNNLKLEEAAEKLRKEVSSYYQSLSKNLVEKIIQDINIALDYEASRLENSLEVVGETYEEYLKEVEKKQVVIQANLDVLKEREKNLAKEIAEVKKLIAMSG